MITSSNWGAEFSSVLFEFKQSSVLSENFTFSTQIKIRFDQKIIDSGDEISEKHIMLRYVRQAPQYVVANENLKFALK